MANAPCGSAHAMASRKLLSYTIATKLQAVELSKRPSKEAAARQFKVDPKRNCEWCYLKDYLVEMNKRLNERVGVRVEDSTEVDEKSRASR